MIWRHGTYSLWRLWIYSSHCVPSFLPSTQVERTNSIFQGYRDHRASQAVPVNPPANARDPKDVASVPGSERSPGGGHGNPPWYSCLENPMDRGAWWGTVHAVPKSWTQWSDLARTNTIQGQCPPRGNVLTYPGSRMISQQIQPKAKVLQFHE